MNERVVRLGASLVGVLAEPVGTGGAQHPSVVFLNSGILHHIGACRLHVRLARRLAAQGVTSLRFDLSGIGDSESRRDTLSFQQSAVLEVQEALDYLAATRGAREFILVGLCSGADLGFWVSQSDPRVVGVAQLDAFAYRTAGYYVRRYAPRVVNPLAWLRFALSRIGLIKGATRGPEPGDDYTRPEYRRRFPPRNEVAVGLRLLLNRGVHLLYLFSGGQSDHYNHRGQYRRSFHDINFGDLLRVEYYANADHLFSGLDHQQQVDAEVCAWVSDVCIARAARRLQLEEGEVTPLEPAALPGPGTGSADVFRVRA